jgi:hypothetical protein
LTFIKNKQNKYYQQQLQTSTIKTKQKQKQTTMLQQHTTGFNIAIGFVMQRSLQLQMWRIDDRHRQLCAIARMSAKHSYILCFCQKQKK